MSEFWMSYEMIAQRYGPGYQGYPLFGAVHLGELEAVAVCILLTARWYRRSPERTRRRILWGVTVLLLADEAVLVIAMLATGQWNWSYLPLHLCSIHIFLCTTCTLTGKDWCKEELYALCTPGAAIALLCPGWLGTKAWSLINLHSVTLHGLLVLYPVLLVAGGFRPQVRRACQGVQQPPGASRSRAAGPDDGDPYRDDGYAGCRHGCPAGGAGPFV